MFDFIVVGKGMMGAAAGRYLSQQSANLAIIGPDEPQDYVNHNGVYASHYDEGRITRVLAKDITWAYLSDYAIKQYPLLEQASGMPFHVPCGVLYVAKDLSGAGSIAGKDQISTELPLELRSYDESRAITAAHPGLAFPADYKGLFELAPAGYINPRTFVRAELAIAAQQGATIVPEVVTKIAATANSVTVTTQGGQVFEAGTVLIAGGAFTNCFELVPQKLALRVKSEITLLAQVSDEEARRLAAMPCLLYQIESSTLNGIYLTPPIRYPDGHYYIKLGCDTIADQNLPDLAAMQNWMQHGASEEMGAAIRAALLSFVPDLKIVRSETKRCLVTYTTHGKPYIDQLAERVFVATGGNGAAAKCADALGSLAARLLLGENWPPEFDRAEFRAVLVD